MDIKEIQREFKKFRDHLVSDFQILSNQAGFTRSEKVIFITSLALRVFGAMLVAGAALFSLYPIYKVAIIIPETTMLLSVAVAVSVIGFDIIMTGYGIEKNEAGQGDILKGTILFSKVRDLFKQKETESFFGRREV